MRTITFRGPGSGLRLDGNDGDVLDVGSSYVPGAPMTLFVGTQRGAGWPRAASINLDPAEVSLLMEECARYLACTHGVPTERRQV